MPCLLLPSLFYDDSPTGLMLDCSVKSAVTIIKINGTTASYVYVIVKLVGTYQSLPYISGYIVSYIVEIDKIYCFRSWTCPLAS